MWRSIPIGERKTSFRPEGEALLAKLTASKQFMSAVLVAADLRTSNAYFPKRENVTNGGFEYDISRDNKSVFDWTIAQGSVPSIGVSVEEKKAGAKSLVMQFTGGPGNEFRDVSQIIAVESGKSYTFSGNYKAELRTTATLEWLIIDAVSGNVLATTGPITADSNWVGIEAQFDVPEATQGVILRIVRSKCQDPSCPIVGTVWFDEFAIR
jgi:hypothetical protein